MTSLKDTSFLDITLHKGRLQFGEKLSDTPPSVRTLDDAKPFLRHEKVHTEPRELYWMHRDVARDVDRHLFHNHKIRYDITIIRPGVLGDELMKTVGHYHPVMPGGSTSYPEVYEVLHGMAIYLLQRPTGNPGEIADVVAITANTGDKVIVPPGYGHVTINPGDDYLVMSNLVAGEFASVYDTYRTLNGAAYHLTVGPQGPSWIKNPGYRCLGGIRFLKAGERTELGLERHSPLYKTFISNPAIFAYLVEPESAANAEVASSTL